MNTNGITHSIQALLPDIRARREEIERERRLPRNIAEALRQTRIFSLSVPRALGGEEAVPIDLMRHIETVAADTGGG